MATAVSIQGVTKTFGDMTAVDRLNLEVPNGALYGFIGPNGAGKTTTIRMLMSIMFPDSGRLEVLGHASALEAKDKIGYLPEERGVYKNMKVAAYLRYIARLKGLAEAVIGGRIKQLLARVELPDVGGKPCEELSKGMRQKIQFAASIINEPELLILDEPFSGLDPVSMRLLRNLIVEEHQRGATILFSTHVMPQAEEICDHVVMIHKGRKVLDDPVAAIGGRHEVRTIVVEPFDALSDTSVLSRIAGVESQRVRGGIVEVNLKPGVDPANVMRDIAGSLRVARIEIKRPRLEDVFVRLVAGDPDDAASLLTELAKPDAREAAE